jgi:hypothetical protein
VVFEHRLPLPEGALVRVVPEAEPGPGTATAIDPLFRMGELAAPTDIPDLASEADHHLYGHPRVTNAR